MRRLLVRPAHRRWSDGQVSHLLPRARTVETIVRADVLLEATRPGYAPTFPARGFVASLTHKSGVTLTLSSFRRRACGANHFSPRTKNG